MKRNRLLNGGRPRTLDDLAVIDEQIRDMELFYGDLGNFIAQGVRVVDNEISAGYVYLNGRILKLDAYTAPRFPVFIVAADPVEGQPKAYESGEVKPTQVEYRATYSLQAPPSPTPYIIVSEVGGRRMADALGVNAKADAQQVSQLAATVSRKMDDPPPGICWPYVGDMKLFGDNGLGIGRLEGWAIADGRNNTFDMRGKFLLGYDALSNPEPADVTGKLWQNYGKVGNTGGEGMVRLTAEQNAEHDHPFDDIFFSEAGGSKAVPGGLGSNRTDNDNRGYTVPSKTQKSGSGHPHENRPPYIVVAWIQKIR